MTKLEKLIVVLKQNAEAYREYEDYDVDIVSSHAFTGEELDDLRIYKASSLIKKYGIL